MENLKTIHNVAAGILAAAILSTTTGCMPSPFNQDVPSTQWQVDEKGNKTKITNPGGGLTAEDVLADKKAVKAALENYQNALKSDDSKSAVQAFMKEAQKVKPSSDAEARKKQEEEFAKKALPTFHTVLDHIDTTGVTEVEQVTLANFVIGVGSMTSGTETKIPDDAVILTGDTAYIDMSKAEIYYEGELTDTVTAEDGKSNTYFVRKDGKWLLNGKKMKESLGIEGSSVKLSISAEAKF
jgi:hypothetical protein